MPRMMPRSKHIGIKYHLFRNYVLNGTLMMKHVNFEYQVADIFKKGLMVMKFQHPRKLLMGW